MALLLLTIGALGVPLLPVTGTSAAFSDTGQVVSDVGTGHFECGAATRVLQPWAYYAMDEDQPRSGDLRRLPYAAADSSGNGRNASYRSRFLSSGFVSLSRFEFAQDGACGSGRRAVRFDGSTTYLSSDQDVWGASASRWNTFTISLWFRSEGTSSSVLMSLADTNHETLSAVSDRHLFIDTAGRVVFGVYPNQVRAVRSPAGTSYNDGRWHQATATLSGDGMRLYLDGALVASDPDVTTAESRSRAFWRVGHVNMDHQWLPSLSDRFFHGWIDEVGIWTRALTPAEVQGLYRSSLTGR